MCWQLRLWLSCFVCLLLIISAFYPWPRLQPLPEWLVLARFRLNVWLDCLSVLSFFCHRALACADPAFRHCGFEPSDCLPLSVNLWNLSLVWVHTQLLTKVTFLIHQRVGSFSCELPPCPPWSCDQTRDIPIINRHINILEMTCFWSLLPLLAPCNLVTVISHPNSNSHLTMINYKMWLGLLFDLTSSAGKFLIYDKIWKDTQLSFANHDRGSYTVYVWVWFLSLTCIEIGGKSNKLAESVPVICEWCGLRVNPS